VRELIGGCHRSARFNVLQNKRIPKQNVARNHPAQSFPEQTFKDLRVP
jgi:hypothetical protein